MDALRLGKWGITRLLIGVEDVGYIRRKGREPLFTLLEKLSLIKALVPDRTIIFPIPSKPPELSSDLFYDALAQQLYVYRRPGVFHIGSDDDYREVFEAKLGRALTPKNVLYLTIGRPPIHTSDLLKY